MSDDPTGIEISFGASTVRIEGFAETPTPCYEALIHSAAVTDGELRIQVGFNQDESDLCAECVGALVYEATVDFETTDGIDTVTVTHGKGDNQFTEKRSGDESPTSTSDEPATTPLDDPGSEPDPDLQVSLDNENEKSHEIHVEIQ